MNVCCKGFYSGFLRMGNGRTATRNAACPWEAGWDIGLPVCCGGRICRWVKEIGQALYGVVNVFGEQLIRQPQGHCKPAKVILVPFFQPGLTSMVRISSTFMPCLHDEATTGVSNQGWVLHTPQAPCPPSLLFWSKRDHKGRCSVAFGCTPSEAESQRTIRGWG